MAPEQALFSDSQFAALLAALVAFGGSLIACARWAVGRVVKAIDDSSAERAKQTEAFIELKSKIEEVHDLVIDRPPRTRAVTLPDGPGALRRGAATRP